MSNTGKGTTGTILQGAGTGTAPKYSTATYPLTTTANQILYSSSTNTVAGLASANSSVLVTDGSGVPSLSTTIPSGVTLPSASGAALVWINSQTASTSATLDFTSIPTYTTYLLTWRNLRGSTDAANFTLVTSSDNGSTWTVTGYEAGINTTPYNSATVTNANSTTNFLLSGPIDNGTTALKTGGECWININTSSPTYINGTSSWADNTAGVMAFGFFGGKNGSATTANAFRVLLSAGNMVVGTVSLYGLRTAA